MKRRMVEMDGFLREPPETLSGQRGQADITEQFLDLGSLWRLLLAYRQREGMRNDELESGASLFAFLFFLAEEQLGVHSLRLTAGRLRKASNQMEPSLPRRSVRELSYWGRVSFLDW